MATGGYKLSKFQWAGGRTDSEDDRTKFVLKGVVQTILDSNTGWSLDSNWNSTIDDVKLMKSYTYSSTTYGSNYMLFLKNGNGMKLAIGYASRAAVLNYDTDCAFKGYIISNNPGGYIHGLYFSFIPSYAPSDDWIEDSTYGITLPNSASRFTAFGYTYGNTYGQNYIYASCASTFVTENVNNTTYQIYILLKSDENVVSIFERKDSWNAGILKGFIFGELIKSFAHSSDTKSLAVFPLFNFQTYPLASTTSSSSEYNNHSEAYTPSVSATNTNDSYNNYAIINQETNFLTTTYERTNLNQIQNANGDIFFSYRTSSELVTGWASVVFVVSNSNQLSLGCIADPQLVSGGRWCPLYSYIYSSDPTTLGVVENDGLKGYLDTDVIRAVTIARYSRGSTFGINKEFLYLGGGLAIGWDVSNTETLF